MTISEVKPGQERAFLGHFRIEDFPLLKGPEARRLKRAGVMRIEELQDMSASQLSRLLGRKDLFELERGLNARDDEMILGLYPPERLYYRQNMEYETDDRQRLQQYLKSAAQRLGRLLEERHVSARRLLLRLQTSRGVLEAERLLQNGCTEAGRLDFLLSALLERSGLSEAASGLDICMDALETVHYEQLELFTMQKQVESAWQETVIADSLEKLMARFPAAISRGMELDRREQILAFWDPWRFGPGLPAGQGAEEAKGCGLYEQVLPEPAAEGLVPGRGAACGHQV